MGNKKQNKKEHLQVVIKNLPAKPGSYQFWNDNKEVIYVGKAKNLKNRVSSYFRGELSSFRTKIMVKQIEEITYTVVNREEDALLLENSLIKKYNPKYNVLLKDSKTYPSIWITNEEFPRIIKTRVIDKKYGTFYGPYSILSPMYAMLNVIKQLCKPRSCKYSITEQSIKEGKYKACLEYHIKNCKAPCIGLQSKSDYLNGIKQAHEILKGNTREILKTIYNEMLHKASNLMFEEAEDLKQKYVLLETFCAKSEVAGTSITNTDVFSITLDDGENNAYVNYLHIKKGAINRAFTFEYKRKLDENAAELLVTSIIQIREKYNSNAAEIIVPFKIEWKVDNAKILVPQRGDKKKLLELSELNAKQYRFDRLKQAEKLNPEQKKTQLMKELQALLGLEKMPIHIECFDNSNISGTNAVAGCVVFKGLKPSKKDYRKYKIKTVVGANDVASMQEVIFRRYKRILKENDTLPDLIITDGGKQQMEAVRKVIQQDLNLNIAIAGLAKNNQHKTNNLLFGFPPKVISIKTTSELFKVLTQIQDEVHRFAITFHKQKRSKSALHSELDDVKGIGTKTKQLLIDNFQTIEKIKNTPQENIEKIIGKSKTKLLMLHFFASKNT